MEVHYRIGGSTNCIIIIRVYLEEGAGGNAVALANNKVKGVGQFQRGGAIPIIMAVGNFNMAISPKKAAQLV